MPASANSARATARRSAPCGSSTHMSTSSTGKALAVSSASKLRSGRRSAILQARRVGTADPAEGGPALLTHHRVHDPGCWDFLEELFAVTAGNGAAEWHSAASLF